MKLLKTLAALVALFAVSCTKEKYEVHHKSATENSHPDLKHVNVVNAEDPVCHMKTAEYLKDTATYQNKTYGFCSPGCKEEFKKNPARYAETE